MKKILILKEWLYEEYIVKKKTAQKIADELNCNKKTILNNLKKFNILARTASESKLKNFDSIQYKNKEWLYQKYIIENKSIKEISKITLTSKRTTHQWLISFNIQTRKNDEINIKNIESLKYKNEKWLKEQYIDNNLSMIDISKLINVNIATVSRWLKKFNIQIRDKCMGENHPNWKGGISSLRDIIKKCFEYKNWRTEIFKKDNFTCVICQKKNVELNADHIKPFCIIIKENNINSLEKALECKELWNLENGRTLCVECHKKTDTFGIKALNYKPNIPCNQ